MKGFDYRVQQEKDYSIAQWREELRAVLASGGQRKVEHGETFAKNARGEIQFEVYGVVRS